MSAAFQGIGTIVKALVAQGAKVAARDAAGKTALHLATNPTDALYERVVVIIIIIIVIIIIIIIITAC